MNTERIKNIIPVNPEELQSLITKAGISINNNGLSDKHLNTVISSFLYGRINADEKNQLVMRIISNQLSNEGKVIEALKHPKLNCPYCGGKGFQTILEHNLVVEPCKGDPSRNSLPCDGSGIKTSLCARCGGLTLNQILKIRQSIIDGKAESKVVRHYGHFANIKVDTLRPDFIQKNGNKTFRVFRSNDTDSDHEYYYIPKDPCKTCNGTGKFVHHRQNIKCPGCGGYDKSCKQCHGTGKVSGKPIKCSGCHGKGNLSKKLVTTGKVKAFLLCEHRCEGNGYIHFNPLINLKALDGGTLNALKTFYAKRPDNCVQYVGPDLKWNKSDEEITEE